MEKLKNILIVVLIIFTVFGQAQNLLLNPGFEGNYSFNALNWSYNPNWTPSLTATYSLSKDISVFHSGTASQKIIVTNKPTYFTYQQSFALKYNRIYLASIWIKSPDTASIDFALRGNAAFYPEASSAVTSTISNTWQKLQLLGSIEGAGNATLSVGFWINFKNTSTVWVDDAVLRDVTDSINKLPVQNPSIPIPTNFFGMHINQLGVHNVWPPVNHGLLRLWDTGTRWCDLQPNSSTTYNWTRLDYYVNHRNSWDPNCELLYTLGMAPKWATTDTNSYNTYGGPGAFRSVKDSLQWKAYVWAVGNRYNNKIKYWEIWNETVVFHSLINNGLDLVQLTRMAREVLLTINPNNIIVSPNFITSVTASDFLHAGGGNYIDIFSFHNYPNMSPELSIGSWYGNLNTLNTYGIGSKPIWNTEGAISQGTPSVNQAIGSIARTFILQWAYGVKNFNYYFWEPVWSTGVNLSSANTGTTTTVTSAGISYKNTVAWLTGKKMINKQVDTTTGVWYVQLINPSTSKNEYIVWNAKNLTTAFNIPQTWGIVTKKDLMGGSSNIACQNTINVNESPILLEEGPFQTYYPQYYGNASVCNGQSITYTVSGFSSYLWSNGSTSTVVTLTPSVNTIYTLTATNTIANCTKNYTFQVNVVPNPTVSIMTPTTQICVGDPLILNATGASSYYWSSLGNQSTYTVYPISNTIYFVSGTNNNLCTATASINITVNQCVGLKEQQAINDCIMAYPNPSNGIIQIKVISDENINECYLYNSLGQKVKFWDKIGQSFVINLEGMSKGVYYLRITGKSEFYKKIIYE